MTDSCEMKHSAIRMIEIGRDEDVCRQMDVDTHHLTPQEHYHYRSRRHGPAKAVAAIAPPGALHICAWYATRREAHA